MSLITHKKVMKNAKKNLLGKERVVITNVYPQLDSPQFAIKRCVDDEIFIEADIFADGHDEIIAYLHYKYEQEQEYSTAFKLLDNDRWTAAFKLEKIGRYYFTIAAWIDPFKTWQVHFLKKLAAKQDNQLDVLIGIHLIEDAYNRSENPPIDLENNIKKIKDDLNAVALSEWIKHPDFADWMVIHSKPHFVTCYPHWIPIVVDRIKARFSTWYEVFPRSLSNDLNTSGTFDDVIRVLPRIKNLGFDILYFPPIHPIGITNRKGKNNTNQALSSDPGSPWAIGNAEGGHMAIHPTLGSMKDFENLIAEAHKNQIEIALDFALQCSPDHPYLKDHPSWFKKRPDGTLQYAENPPKKYQDIYPFNFESDDWESLWLECKKILLFWIKRGIKIFRVDNPHTKPFVFWEWLIANIKNKYPDVIFLAEAFTRPNIMYHLAKIGFTQSYTYFTWRNTKTELTTYLEELKSVPIVDFFRPNFWPNTPDILHEYLQIGGKNAFVIRLILAATLAGNYGIYGPVFEFCINKPLESGSEEYLDSEKYETKHWQFAETGIEWIVAKVNAIRHQHPALQSMTNLYFHVIDNPEMICYSKCNTKHEDTILVIVNLDVKYKQCGFVNLSLEALNIQSHSFEVHDLLTDKKYWWEGKRNYVEIDPNHIPAHIFHIKKSSRDENNFERY